MFWLSNLHVTFNCCLLVFVFSLHTSDFEFKNWSLFSLCTHLILNLKTGFWLVRVLINLNLKSRETKDVSVDDVYVQELTEEGLPFLILFHHPDDIETPERFKKVVAQELIAEKSNWFLIRFGSFRLRAKVSWWRFLICRSRRFVQLRHRAVKSCQKTHPGNRSRQDRLTMYT